jgi:hypothetical protein
VGLAATGVVDRDYVHVRAGGQARLGTSFPDGSSQTILFAEKYAVSSIEAEASPSGKEYKGGSHWACFQADCQAALFAYFYPGGGA